MEDEPRRPVIAVCFAELPEEERTRMIDNMPDGGIKKSLIQRREEGVYKRCHKTDWCRLAREEKEKAEREKEAERKTLQQRNEILEQHARSLAKEFTDYRALTDKRLEQIVGLLKGLLEDK